MATDAATALDQRISGDGHVLPTDAAGLLRYWKRYGGGKYGMPRETFVASVRTMIDSGQVSDPQRRVLVGAGFAELDT